MQSIYPIGLLQLWDSLSDIETTLGVGEGIKQIHKKTVITKATKRVKQKP